MTDPLPDHVPLSEVTIDVAGLPLLVRVWGDRAKPVVLLQHGGKDHGRSWDWTVAALAEDYCLVVPDLRGHGDSGHAPGGGYAEALMLSDMARIGEWVAGWRPGPIAVVGHSLGGNLALRYAASYPERVSRVVSMEGLGFSQSSYDEVTAEPLERRMRRAADKRLAIARGAPRRFATIEEGIERMAGLHRQLSAERSRHLAVHALREDERGWGWKHDPLVAFLDPRPTPPAEYLPVYASIGCPVLLIYGRDSWATSPKEDGRIEAFGDARLVEYDGAGHWLHHDAFEAFVRDLRAFLAEERP